MINLKTTENSIKLLTKGKYCDDDINVTFEGGSIEGVTEDDTQITITTDKQLRVNSNSNIGLTKTNEVSLLPSAITTLKIPYAGAVVNATNLEPQNIVKDVNILGVVGTYEGGGSSEEYPSEAIAYYKQTRNKNYPYFPLPYEMTETQDTIYMLYGASGYMCCPAFQVTFTNCVCTVQKYMNTTLVSENVVNDIVSGKTYYMQFSEEDSDYSTYNYIVIKLQGNITKHYLNYQAMFNGVEYNMNSSSELVEVSGKCNSCDIKVVNTTSKKCHQNLEYYSFMGVSSTSMSAMFNCCYSLQVIPQLDCSKTNNTQSMFYYCYSLQIIPQLDMSSCTSTSEMFYNCYSLQTIPQLNTSSCDTMNNMFYNCYSLQTIPQLDCSKTNNAVYMFYNCYSLQTIPQLDMSSCTKTSSMFNKCYILAKINIINMKVSFDLSNSTMLSQTELVNILNNLATVETTQKLTLGSTNLAKLTDDEKAIATAKGWTLA